MEWFKKKESAPKRRITGIMFLEKGHSAPTKLFVGTTIHLPHEGECTKDMECEKVVIEKMDVVIGIKGDRVIVLAKNIRINYFDVEIRIIYDRYGE
jgi:hypothetical protein